VHRIRFTIGGIPNRTPTGRFADLRVGQLDAGIVLLLQRLILLNAGVRAYQQEECKDARGRDEFGTQQDCLEFFNNECG